MANIKTCDRCRKDITKAKGKEKVILTTSEGRYDLCKTCNETILIKLKSWIGF